MLKRNLIANYFGQVWAAVMGMAFLPAYVHYLGLEAYGIVGLYAVLQACLGVLDFGMTPTLNRELARFGAGAYDAQGIRNLLRSIEVVCFAVGGLIAGAVWAASDLIARLWLKVETLPTAVVAQAVGVMALVLASRFCEGIYRGALLGMQRHVQYNLIFAVSATLRWAGSVGVLAFVSATVQAFFLWQAIVSILTIVAMGFVVHSNLPPAPAGPRFSVEAVRGVWKFASGMLAISVLVMLLTQLDKLVISKLLPLTEFAAYSFATSVVAGLTFIAGPVGQTFYPPLTDLMAAGNQDALKNRYHQGAQVATVAVSPPALMLIFFAEPIVLAWSGDPQLASRVAPLLSLLSVGTFLNCLMVMPYMLQLAAGWTSLTVWMNLGGVVVLLPAMLWAVPKYGAVGAIWCWIALNSSYVLLGIYLMHRRLLPAEKWRWAFADILLPGLPALAAVAALRWLVPLGDSRYAALAQLIVYGALAVGAAVLAAPDVRRVLMPLVARQETSRR